MKSSSLRSLCAAVALTAGGLVQADNSVEVGSYTVHYNAFTSDFLPPAMARNYEITRSGNRGVLNVSVIKKAEGTTGQSVTAQVLAGGARLTGQHFDIPMREIKDGDAIYYLGDFGVVEGENVKLKVEVTPPGEKQPYLIQFNQEFFPR